MGEMSQLTGEPDLLSSVKREKEMDPYGKSWLEALEAEIQGETMSSKHSSRLQFVLVCLLAGIAALVSCANPFGDSAEAFMAQTLLSSGLAKCKLRFGGLDGNRLQATELLALPHPPDKYHGECQIAGLLGVDFEIRFRLRFDQGSKADIQFRVSNEGRYGVRFEPGSFVCTPSRTRGPCPPRILRSTVTFHCGERSRRSP